VEKAFGTAKAALEKAHKDGTDPYVALLEVRNTLITGLNHSPAQIFLNRRLKTKLPTTAQLLKAQIPTDVRSQLLAQQQKQKFYFDRETKSLPPLKVSTECCSGFSQFPAGIRRGTKIEPWPFLLMINVDSSIARSISSRMWKFAYDTTLWGGGIVPRDGINKLQAMVQQVTDWPNNNMF